MGKAKVLMFQGTSSGVGKSITTTAICRILKEDGYKVAPFKVQNLSSNFFEFENGDKIAKSQVYQAYSCGIEPTVDMNPVLLAPNNDGGCDIFLQGKHFGSITSAMDSNLKDELFAAALESFERLCNEYDYVIVEGAGSPVEMNLNKYDIVNMGFAEKVNAPVILISDITRGGVFANLYGTVGLFTENQKSLVKGLIVNKFIGTIENFYDGVEIIEDLCKKKVIGVVPHTTIKLEDEDNLIDTSTGAKDANEFENVDNKKYQAFLDKEFSSLSKHFREFLDMEYIYSILK